jgi:hypothetical protein
MPNGAAPTNDGNEHACSRMPTYLQQSQRAIVTEVMRYLLATFAARAASHSRIQTSRSDT